MKVDRELLWKAYPDGYLAMRGVETVGGWQCVGCGEWGSNWLHVGTGTGMFPLHAPGFPDFEQAKAAGRLLPSLDPTSDPATWACVKRDLAIAVGAPPDVIRVSWRRQMNLSAGPIYTWALTWSQDGARGHRFNLDIGHHATALATLRAQLRERVSNDG